MHPRKIAIITPVFNDWDALEILINDLSKYFYNISIQIQLLVIDDCSNIGNYPFHINSSKNIQIQIIKLKCNLGHQRALAVGLCETLNYQDLDGVLLMDCDGEDKVENIWNLINNEDSKIVVAKRSSRSEGVKFKIFYIIYKFIFRILSGKVIDFGNFCYIPYCKVRSLVNSPNVWNHIAATIVRLNIPLKKIATSRGERYCGKSKLNFTGLVLHGLGAMSVLIDLIFTRLLYFLAMLITTIIFLAIIVLILKFFTTLSTPGWTTTLIGIFSIISLQAIIIILISAFMVLNNRTTKLFIPAKDASFFIQERIKIC